MTLSVAAILGELRLIEQQSPEDVAVLMTPLLRALEAARDGRESPLDHAQIMAIANSLAQTAAQVGDVDVAVAIATMSAELEQISPEAFAPRPPTLPATATRREPPRPFARPYQQLLGVVGICALSYAGYLEIQFRFFPGSVTSWLLTGSSSLFALALALGWRRYVIRNERGQGLTALALAFALVAGAWAVKTSLALGPQIAATPTAPTAALPAAGPAAQPAAPAPALSSASAPSPAPTGEAPIVFWWLGEMPERPATRIPDPAVAGAETPPEPAPARSRSRPPQADSDWAPTPSAPTPSPRADLVADGSAAAAMSGPDTPMMVYQSLLNRDVVMTDVKGGQHLGKLTGISKYGVTLLMEVRMFDQPILASRFYLFDNIETLRAK
jgi:hypothetical protein